MSEGNFTGGWQNFTPYKDSRIVKYNLEDGMFEFMQKCTHARAHKHIYTHVHTYVNKRGDKYVGSQRWIQNEHVWRAPKIKNN